MEDLDAFQICLWAGSLTGPKARASADVRHMSSRVSQPTETGYTPAKSGDTLQVTTRENLVQV
jgi:hypothetical protein